MHRGDITNTCLMSWLTYLRLYHGPAGPMLSREDLHLDDGTDACLAVLAYLPPAMSWFSRSDAERTCTLVTALITGIPCWLTYHQMCLGPAGLMLRGPAPS